MNKKFYKALLFMAPILVMVASYFILDPFKVLKSYNNYYEDAGKPGYKVIINRDFANTEKYLSQYEEYKYDSFIFGNSRTSAYKCTTWQQLDKTISPYHFDADLESLYGVEAKLRKLESLNRPIKNVILAVDYDLLKQTKNVREYLYIKHYALTGESRFSFHKVFFSTFFTKLYFINYFYFLMTQKIIPWLGEDMLGKMQFYFNRINNDFLWESENEILRNEQAYYEKHKEVFYQRDASQAVQAPVLGSEQIQLLKSIREIFRSSNTDFRVIVNPTYDQKKLDPSDVRQLQSIFGAERFFDFSGRNRFTENRRNYYESSHFRPHVGDEILREIFASPRGGR